MNLKILINIILVQVSFGTSSLNIQGNLIDWANAVDPLETPHYQNIVKEKLSSNINSLSSHGREGKIVNGDRAVLGQFPHHALIYSQDLQYNYICGGSLIRIKWILTSAHCTYEKYDFEILLGIVDQNEAPLWRTIVDDLYENLKIHSNYSDATLENDIALIFMKNATENILSWSFISLIQLPLPADGETNLLNRDSTVAGFGRTSDSSATNSQFLQHITVPIISNARCAENYQTYDTNICVNATNRKSICFGDSGGGLVTEISAGRKVIIGVASFGMVSECELGVPFSFTRVTMYLNWIGNVINETLNSTTTTSLPPTTTSIFQNSSKTSTVIETTTPFSISTPGMSPKIITLNVIFLIATNCIVFILGMRII